MQFLLLLLFLVLLIIATVVTFLFTSGRRREPIIVHVASEKYSEQHRRIGQSRIRDDEHSNIQSLIERIKEIDEKIRIVLEKDISDEAKKIIIHELEEEKRKLEEELRG